MLQLSPHRFSCAAPDIFNFSSSGLAPWWLTTCADHEGKAGSAEGSWYLQEKFIYKNHTLGLTLAKLQL